MKKYHLDKNRLKSLHILLRPQIVIFSVIVAFLISILDVIVVAIFSQENSFTNLFIHNYTSFHHLVENIIILLIVPILGISIGFILSRNKIFRMSLMSSEEKYYRLVENSKDIIYRMSIPEGKYEYISNSVKEITGHYAFEFYKDAGLMRRIIHHDSWEYFNQEHLKIMKGELTSTYEYKINSPDGQIKWLHQRNVLITDENRKAIAIEAIVTDITELKNIQNSLYQKNIEIQSQNEKLITANEKINSQLEDLAEINDELTNVYMKLKESKDNFENLYKNLPLPAFYFEKKDNDFELINYNNAALSITDGHAKKINSIKAGDFYDNNPEILQDMNYVYNNKTTFCRDIIYNFKLFKSTKALKINYGYIPPNAVIIHLEDITNQKEIENKIKNSELQYRTLAENVPCIVYRVFWNKNKRMHIFNDMLKTITGYETPDLLGGELNPIESLIVKEDYQVVLTEAKAAILEKRPYTLEYRLIHREGHIIYCNERSRPIFDASDKLLYIDGVVFDVTDYKQLENNLISKNEEIETQNEELISSNEELINAYENLDSKQKELEIANESLKHTNIKLEESEKQIHKSYKDIENIFQAINHPLFIIDNKYNITRINLRGIEVYGNGKNESQILGEKCYSIIHNLKSPSDICHACTMIKSGVIEHTENEFKINNRLIHFTCSAMKNEENKINNIIHFGTDITEKRESENLIKESEKKYRELAESLPQIVFEIDLQGNIIYANDVAYKTFEASKEVNNINIFTMIDEPDINKVKDNIIKSCKGEKAEKIEYNLVRKDGSTFPVIVYTSPVIKDGILIGLRGILTDISERKEYEEIRKQKEIAENTLKIKQQFLANMSHEMRTPMTGILGMTDFLLNTNLNEKQKFYADTIKSSSLSLLNIINDVLNLSKIEAGRLELIPSTFILENTLNRIKNLFLAIVNKKGIELSIYIDPKLPEEIFSDENRLNQIINNLVGNAIKFTDKGSVNIKAFLEQDLENSLKIRIEVIDTGIGIKKENQKKIFNMFTQLDSTNTRAYSGTGLGLTICKEYIELMGGEINVESKENEGSRFWFTFIATKNNDIESLSNNTTTDYDNINLKLNVLLAEDVKTNQIVISMMLNNIGCKVDVANNGEECLKMAELKLYDIILMDIQMPVMDGMTATRKINEKYNGIKKPVIIGLSAKAMEGDAEQYISSGMDDYITKPIQIEELYHKLIKYTS